MGRGKGLKRRVIDLIAGDPDGLKILDDILLSAQILPREGWLNRLLDQKPVGPGESFFSAVKQQVDARSEIVTNGYSLETAVEPATETLIETAKIFSKGLNNLVQLILQFCGILSGLLDDKKETIETHNRIRIEAIIRSLTRRGSLNLKQWQSMLDSISNTGKTEFIDWLEIERLQGHNIDIGMRRHWLDPTAPLTKNVFNPAHGIIITSATLREESIKLENQWEIAEKRTGTIHLKTPAIQVTVDSPFDYSKQSQVIIVNDVKRNDLDQVAAAYRDLFIAANGGSLGLFTAIRRLRAVHGKIFHPLDKLDLKVYSQHSDGLNLSTLIDIFRMEENSCLLGTDAARDGVDIPGRSLRLIVFDRVPWPRPAILNKARQELFGRKIYTDMLTKIKLTQAFGRLIRSKTDKGIFILLDPRMPTRLLTAFPKETAITRCNLANAISEVKTFLNP
jgi:ATP-dependent DNA helicase DinG